MFRNVTCSNCNLTGHIYNNCPGPFISYGVILCRQSEITNQLEYLMLRRRHSFGFIDFVKGKYSFSNLYHIKNSIDQMSISEKNAILQNKHAFLKIWNILDCGYSHKEFQNAFKKFEQLKSGIMIHQKMYTLDNLFESSNTQWPETEWEFPKGRKMLNESETECAIREFVEETGISASSLNIIDNLSPLVEHFIGSNLKPYHHSYIVAMTKQTSQLCNFQTSEVSKLDWKTVTDCETSIRPYHIEKQTVLRSVNTILTTALEIVE